MNITFLLVVVYGNGNGKNRNYIQEFYLLTSSSSYGNGNGKNGKYIQEFYFLASSSSREKMKNNKTTSP